LFLYQAYNILTNELELCLVLFYKLLTLEIFCYYRNLTLPMVQLGIAL